MAMEAVEVIKALSDVSGKNRAEASQWFFKTGKGQYGEGDVFIGVTVPEQRKIARQYRSLPLVEIETLLESNIHEHRLTGLLILVYQFEKATEQEKFRIKDFYMDQLDRVNNWDLVDSSADKILGRHLLVHQEELGVLQILAESPVLWHRRVAMIATYAFIKADRFGETLRLAEKLLDDKEDLMHKAAGWMLREVGKRDETVLVAFLNEHAVRMPRTMLRYAIERLSVEQKKKYMGMKKL